MSRLGALAVEAEFNVLLRNEKSVPCNLDALAGSIQVVARDASAIVVTFKMGQKMVRTS